MKPSARLAKIKDLCTQAAIAETRNKRKRMSEVTRDLKKLMTEQIKYEIRMERKASC